MRVFITGGTGSIGRRLVRALRDRGDEPVILSRDADKTRRDPTSRGIKVVGGDPATEGPWQREIDGSDAVVTLAGQGVFAGRWDSETKRKIRDSRVYGTDRVVEAIRRSKARPSVLVQGSAIGYYGSTEGDAELTESSPAGSDFLAVVCREWEDATKPVEPLGVRLATIRTGVVLSRGEGALGAMAPLFRWVPGGAAPIGTGRQWVSWIHVDDIVGLFLLGLDRPDASGPINGTAPEPARNVDFSRALARTLHRPFLPVGPPEFALKLMLGEKAEVVTRGQRVLPERALSLGYAFRHPGLAEALRAVFDGGPVPSAPAGAPVH